MEVIAGEKANGIVLAGRGRPVTLQALRSREWARPAGRDRAAATQSRVRADRLECPPVGRRQPARLNERHAAVFQSKRQPDRPAIRFAVCPMSASFISTPPIATSSRSSKSCARCCPQRGSALEIASGTGSTWPGSRPACRAGPGNRPMPTVAALPAIEAATAQAGLANVRAPLRLDVLAPQWPRTGPAVCAALRCRSTAPTCCTSHPGPPAPG